MVNALFFSCGQCPLFLVVNDKFYLWSVANFICGQWSVILVVNGQFHLRIQQIHLQLGTVFQSSSFQCSLKQLSKLNDFLFDKLKGQMRHFIKHVWPCTSINQTLHDVSIFLEQNLYLFTLGSAVMYGHASLPSVDHTVLPKTAYFKGLKLTNYKKLPYCVCAWVMRTEQMLTISRGPKCHDQ